MNSKKLKKKKENNSFLNSNNDNAEVLVLPPNLLEKLGINLGNIQPDVNNPMNTSSTETLDHIVSTAQSEKQCMTIEKPYVNNSGEETSILKTANLMKESVLLSPTFTTLKPNDVLAEEDTNYLNNTEKFIEDKQIVFNQPILVPNGHLRLNTEQTKEYPHTDNLDVIIAENKTINNNCAKLMQERICDTISNTDLKADTLERISKSPDILMSSESCEFALYKSTKNINQKPTSKPNNKITVLSQEILDAEKIKQLKFFNSAETEILIPLKIDTILSKHNINITEKTNLKELESQCSLNKEQQNNITGIKKNDNIQCVSKKFISRKMENKSSNKCYNSSGDLVNISNSVSKDVLNHTDEEEINNLSYNEKNSQKCLEKLGVVNISHKDDSSNETLAHISKDAKENNTFSTQVESTLYGMENINVVHIHDRGCDCRDQKFNSEENIVTSKLCIQGVEKPGGELEFFTVNRNIPIIKTYKSKKTKSCYPKTTSLENFLENNVDIDYKLNVEKDNIQVIPKFCICKDFGTFDGFNSEEVELSYEHVHFLKQTTTHCSLLDLFSIYEEKFSTFEEEKEDKNIQNLDGYFDDIVTNDPFDNNICWHHIESVNKKSVLDKNLINEFNQNAIIEQAESSKNICLGTNENYLQTKTVIDKESLTDANNKCEKVSINNASNKVPSRGSDCVNIKTTVEIHNSSKAEGYDSCKKMLLQQESTENVPKKRKRCSNSESNYEIISKKQVLDTIRCEICGNRITKIKWKDHISKKHCFIAWKESETFNFEDKKLLLKLNWRLSETGKLVCTFCDNNQYDLQKFIAHVNACISKRRSFKKYETPSRRQERNIGIDQSASQSIILVTCGVCQSEIEENLWFEHISKEHNYLAWEQGADPVDGTDEEKVLKFLKITMKTIGPLECSYCGVKRTNVACYIKHLKSCANIELLSPKSKIYRENENQYESESLLKPTKRKRLSKSENECEHVTCGVCHTKVESHKWLDHICKEHAYLAWKEEENELNVNDAQQVNDHLYSISKENDGLICAKCGIRRKYVKAFLTHIQQCTGQSTSQDTTFEVTLNDSSMLDKIDNTASADDGDGEKIIKCGVCHAELQQKFWQNHIQKEHAYLAWKEGEPALNVNDAQKVNDHLYSISKENDGLICAKCGIRRKYVKAFLTHIQQCTGQSTSQDTTFEVTLNDSSMLDKIDNTASADDGDGEKIIKCGVCHAELEQKFWQNHIQKEHAYLAWKEGEPALNVNDAQQVNDHLYSISKENDGLICAKCGIRRKYVKAFLTHIQQCTGQSTSQDTTFDVTLNDSFMLDKIDNTASADDSDGEKIVKCGVCHAELEQKNWQNHIQKEHAYLAWKEGEPALNVNNAHEVNNHLYSISKENDGLICAKCGIRRKYVKAFLTHIQQCTGQATSQDTTFDATVNDSSMLDKIDNTASADDGDGEKIIKCGVCHAELEQKNWQNHIQNEHAYLAWKEGEPALNLENQQEVMQHLNEMNKKYNGLVCNKCGLTRKYVKVYLSHFESCESTFVSSTPLKQERIIGKDSYECAVCSEVVDPKDWKSHAMTKHYNIAWVVGDYPIDLKNPYAVENYLKEYKKFNKKLECLLCGTSRVSHVGFYAHIIQCGKSETEIEEFKNHCDICDSKYLCIYKNQHVQMHREQEYAIERKKLMEKSKMKLETTCENDSPSAGRLAAKRARNFIGKYEKFEYNCPLCGFGTDEETDLENHKCRKKKYKDHSDSEESISTDESSDESEEVESNASLSENELSDTVRKHGDSRSFSTMIKRIPFVIKNPKVYLNQSAEEFCKIHYTNDTLYPQWRNCKYKVIPDEDIPKYMPPINESCKLLTSQSDWKTLNKFEAMKINGGYIIFVGSSIQCISWATGVSSLGDVGVEKVVGVEGGVGVERGDGKQHFLAVSCHNDSDSPRFDSSQTFSHANMLQIWDFGNLTTSDPKFALGIAHEYGCVWSLDWCASGSRDLKHSKTSQRLGLLAAACSNGSAYIFSVPYPASITDSDKIIYNLTPVAELRLCRGERKKFQATAISWSPQRGHSVVLVGYSDGTTASFDLESESPLLKETLDGVNIFYPFNDERSHNSSVTGVSVLAGGHAGRAGRAGVWARGACAASSASPTGAETARRAASAVRLRAHLPCSAVLHSELWPSALLAENDSIVAQAVNELDWWGRGQRLGAVQAGAACGRCGALAAAAPPLLRRATPHPARVALNKEPVAYINMTPLATNQTKRKIDELVIKLEPRTYEDAVKSYGIEFKYIKEIDKKTLKQIYNQPKENCPERFPLNDIPSMAFNPSPLHHRKLAVATHAGFIFVLTV